MKKLIATTFLVITCTNPVFAAGNQYQLQVAGLACPFCAYGIEKKLSSIEGVEGINIDVAKGQVIVTVAKGITLLESLAREKVKKAGFSLQSFTKAE